MNAKKDFLTVGELNFYIAHVFSTEELLRSVPVMGEVSGISVVKGHCYFTLKDENAEIKAVYFNCAGGYVPHNGEKVLVRGAVDFYSKKGQLSLKVYEIIPKGQGLLHVQLEELKNRLSAEGLFREEYKKEIPLFPKNIALITSVKGAAMQDFIITLRRKNTISDLTVIDVRVQGEACVKDIMTALTNADDFGFDVIILCRGGGSFEDLFPFNNESLVRTIFSMQTPVISAVGHETDYTLCDFVADYRAITPTAAAEKVGYDITRIKNKILSLAESMREAVVERYETDRSNIRNSCARLVLDARNLLTRERMHLGHLTDGLKRRAIGQYTRNSNTISNFISNLELLNPLKLLKCGYFRILNEKNELKSIAEMQISDVITIIGHDGKVEAVVSKKELSNEI